MCCVTLYLWRYGYGSGLSILFNFEGSNYALKGVVQVFKIEWDFRGSEINIFANISISKWSHVHAKSCLFIVADVDIRK